MDGLGLEAREAMLRIFDPWKGRNTLTIPMGDELAVPERHVLKISPAHRLILSTGSCLTLHPNSMVAVEGLLDESFPEDEVFLVDDGARVFLESGAVFRIKDDIALGTENALEVFEIARGAILALGQHLIGCTGFGRKSTCCLISAKLDQFGNILPETLDREVYRQGETFDGRTD